MIPLHPLAAEALQPVIELAREQNARKRFDPSAGRPVQHAFLVRGKLLSNAFLFDLSLKAACTAAGLVDSAGRPTITAHGSGTPSAPSSPRAAPASRRSWRARPQDAEHVDHLLHAV